MKLPILLAAVVLLPAAASAQRLDHRNQPSVEAAALYEQLIRAARGDEETRSDPGGLFELAYGIPLNDEGGEGYLGLRVGGGGGTRLVAPYLFYRGYAGDEEWKTFFDAGVFARILPDWAIAGRLGGGLQYDFGENFGAFLTAGASVGYGDGLQVGIDGGVGLQLRFGTPAE